MDFTELACRWIEENPNTVAIQPMDAASFKYTLQDVSVIVKNDSNDGIVELPIKDCVNYRLLVSKYSTLIDLFDPPTKQLYDLLSTYHERDLYVTKIKSPQKLKELCKELIEDEVYILEYEIPHTILMQIVNSDIDTYLNSVDFDLLFKAIY